MYLTKRQREIYQFICDFVSQHGYAPSYEEIRRHFRLSSLATVHKHITNLEKKGVITKGWNQGRSLEIVDTPSPPPVIEIPLVGTVAAGQPIQAVEEQETLAVPADMVRRGRTYALRVRGNSMIDEHILDGDYVIVEERQTAYNGEIVIALLNREEATIKKFYQEKGGIRLQPANPALEPIIIREGEFAIQGVVIGLIRKFR
ncbi:MAG: transcriptional repressor LexA [Nitrospinota bacterium]|nr:MAG: transcriptional repressor LexA [Nitrospinota bacterium]